MKGPRTAGCSPINIDGKLNFVSPLYYNVSTGGALLLHISDAVEKKLRERHQVDQFEILECFGNQTRTALIEDREEHRTDPSTLWFIAETDSGRRLKVVFIQHTALGCFNQNRRLRARCKRRTHLPSQVTEVMSAWSARKI
jgi:hypothetical protein